MWVLGGLNTGYRACMAAMWALSNLPGHKKDVWCHFWTNLAKKAEVETMNRSNAPLREQNITHCWNKNCLAISLEQVLTTV